MKELFGSPGKLVGSFLFAVAFVGSMASASASVVVGTLYYDAIYVPRNLQECICYLIASMGLQALWSYGPACFSSHALRLKRGRQAFILVSLFVVGDWVTSVLFPSLGAASSSADSQE